MWDFLRFYISHNLLNFNIREAISSKRCPSSALTEPENSLIPASEFNQKVWCLWKVFSAFALQPLEQKTTPEQAEQGRTRLTAERQVQQWLLENSASRKQVDGRSMAKSSPEKEKTFLLLQSWRHYRCIQGTLNYGEDQYSLIYPTLRR